MEVRCTEVKKEVVLPVLKKEVVESDIILLDDAARKKKRRQDRMEIMRRKRNNLPLDDLDFVYKRQRVEPVYSFHVGQPAAMDPSKLRQLKNRESAERSRLKKDHLIDSLTCQVCECYVQLTDLQLENRWLKDRLENVTCSGSECSSCSISVAGDDCDMRSPLTDNDSYSVRSPFYLSSSNDESSSLRSRSESFGWDSCSSSSDDYSSIIEDFDLLLENNGHCHHMNSDPGTLCC